MKIIYTIGAKFAGGGIGTIAYQAGRGLHQQGYLHRLLCGSYQPTEIPAGLIRSFGWPNRLLRKLATFDSSRRVGHWQAVLFDLWAARQLEQGDWLHSWLNFGLRCLQRAKDLGLKTVVQGASSHPTFQAKLLQAEYRRWGLPFQIPQPAIERANAEIALADYLLIPSDFVRDSYLQMGVPAGKLWQVAFGVDSHRFRPGLADPARPFRVLFVGQIGLRKGIPYLLEAWRQLGWQDGELWLVGQIEPAFAPLQPRWANLPGLRYVGFVPEPVQMYQQADLFVFPTIEEGSALVTYEAMACGLPLVTTPNAGAMVSHEQEGWLVPAGEIAPLAAALDHLRSNAPLRRQMGAAARQRAQSLTWQQATQEQLNNYERFR